MIERRKKEYGWEFFFISADLDAIETAGRCGIDSSRTAFYRSDPRGTRHNYKVMSNTVSCVRRGAKVSEAWKESIEEDAKR